MSTSSVDKKRSPFWILYAIKRYRKGIAGGLLLTGISIVGIGYYCLYSLLSMMYNSIKPVEPNEQMMEEQKQNIDKNILFRAVPALRNKIAWLSLGTYPSEIDLVKVILPRSDKQITIALKREDLVNKCYGGNKVRTLEYQLACAKIQCAGTNGKLISVGGGGSNQIVAASTFCAQNNIPLMQVPFGDEAASFDNGMNLISHMSFSYFDKAHFTLPTFSFLREVYQVLGKGKHNLIAMPGGANVTGALGHVHAIFELVEQIKQKDMKAPKHIFLALGSSCTTSGLIAGMALIRKLNVGKELYECQINAIGIHPGPDSWLGHKMIRSAINKLARDTLKVIHRLGGPNATKGELTEAMKQLNYVTKHAVQYGQWTDEALLAKAVMNNGKIITSDNPLPWMCSCFSAKSFAALIAHIEGLSEKESFNACDEAMDGEYLFWCTKSRVQPLYDGNLAKKNSGTLNKVGSEWLQKCHINQEQDYLPYVNKISD